LGWERGNEGRNQNSASTADEGRNERVLKGEPELDSSAFPPKEAKARDKN
jgi:hypothetical protein